jgi:hypothetical protein
MSGVSSMHLAGSVTTDGQKTTLDFSGNKAKDCTGTSSTTGVGSMDVIRTSAGTWAKPDAAAWQSMAGQVGAAGSGAAVAEVFKGRWVTGGETDPDVMGATSMCDMFAGFFDGFSQSGNPTMGSASTVRGIPAIGLQVTDDSGPSTLYVATQGQPYLLRVQSDGDGSSIDIDGFDKSLNIQAPPADQVIDFSKFQQQAKSS